MRGILPAHCILCCADNVYGVLPRTGWMEASIIIMLIHQIIAYALCEHLSDHFVACSLDASLMDARWHAKPENALMGPGVGLPFSARLLASLI